jgi:hypothetical protein
MIRTVSLFSTADLSRDVVKVTGLSCAVDANGNPSSPLIEHEETIGGPNNGKVETSRIYKRIDSITLSNRVSPTEVNFSVGFGTSGITDYVFLNLNSSSPLHYGCQGQPIDADATDFSYQFYSSMTRPETINYLYGNLSAFSPIAAFPLLPAVAHDTNSVFCNLISPVGMANIVWANIKDVKNPPQASFYFTVLQQGLHS